MQYTYIFRGLCAIVLASCFLNACAGPVERWVLNTRVHQGDLALARGNVNDAELSYRLALRVDPANQRARSGFVDAAGNVAQQQYANGRFEDALQTINGALKYDPSSVRLGALRTTIEQARLKREIVISNYPSYRETGIQLQTAYKQLDLANKQILKSLKRFGYTYDTGDLTTAIRRSYELQLEIARNTTRLINYRQVVDSGIPESSQRATSSKAASLLPLP
ncbi:MAG: hypothetical protein M3R51_00775 [Candidatus Eremiobacteraeota bacterium]|nr:hypothetical protein [Candidatus Eremiobacteraeota bacterium]